MQIQWDVQLLPQTWHPSRGQWDMGTRCPFTADLSSSGQSSCPVVSDSLRPHKLQHARPPCPSPTPGVYSDSCPLSRWCHPTSSSSAVPFSFPPPAFNLSQHRGLFKWVSSSHQVAKVLGFQLQHQSFQPFIKRLFSSSSLSAIRVVSSAYLRLLIFLWTILIPACASSSLAFYMIYSAYKLNKQGDNIQPWCNPFLIWSQSIVPGPILTVASWPAYKFLRRQVSWSSIHIPWRIFHSLLWSTQSKALS